MSYKDHAGRVKKVLLNGVEIGTYVSTGDMLQDAEAAHAVIKAKGLNREVSPIQSRYNQAHAFLSAAADIYAKYFQANTFNPVAAAPFIVNAALAIELYIKTLHMAGGRVAKGHKLLALYDTLPEGLRRTIDAIAAQSASKFRLESSGNYRECLANLNNAFEQWRYVYELRNATPIHIQDTIFVLEVLHQVSSAEVAKQSQM